MGAELEENLRKNLITSINDIDNEFQKCKAVNVEKPKTLVVKPTLTINIQVPYGYVPYIEYVEIVVTQLQVKSEDESGFLTNVFYRDFHLAFIHLLNLSYMVTSGSDTNKPIEQKNRIIQLKESFDAMLLLLERIMFTYYIDGNTIDFDEEVEQMIRLKKRIVFLIRQLDWRNMLLAIEGYNDGLSLVLDFLGIKKNTLDPDIIYFDHKPLLYWLNNHFENQIDRNDWPESTKDLRRLLNDLGFTERRSSILAMWMFEKLDHKDVLYWIKHYLEIEVDLFYNKVINCPKDHCENLVANVSTYNRETNENSQSTITVPASHIDFDNSKNAVKHINSEITKLTNKGDCYWFHGTTYKDMDNILEKEIDLSCGAERNDFSKKGNGFYVTHDLSYALDYGIKKRSSSNRAVLLVFVINDSFKTDYIGIDLTNDQELWRKVVSHYGTCKKGEHSAVRTMSYIEGPVSR